MVVAVNPRCYDEDLSINIFFKKQVINIFFLNFFLFIFANRKNGQFEIVNLFKYRKIDNS